MKTAEEILDAKIIRFPSDDNMKHEDIRRNVLKAMHEYAASQCGGRWVKASDNWDDVILRGKWVRNIETKDVIPYREIAKSVSFGNKCVKCWTSIRDIESYPAERLEYFDETPSPCPHEQEVKRLREALLQIQDNYGNHDEARTIIDKALNQQP